MNKLHNIMEFKVMCITGYSAGLQREHNGLLSRVTIQLMFMLIQVFLKEQFYVFTIHHDISTNITSSIRLSVDDCVLYRVIHSEQGRYHLQQDLNFIIQWTKQWQMNLNIDKCVILTCSRSTLPPEFQYYI